MKITPIKLSVVTLAAMAGCTSNNKEEVKKPNVVLIYADDIGIGDLACYGDGIVPTPNVDSLAASGVRLTEAHTTSSTSTPSRFGLLTGQYPWRYRNTGIAAGDAGMIIKPQTYTVADLVKSEGYTTGAVGKWHLGLGETSKQDWNGVVTPNLSDIGFDYSYIMAATGDRVPCVFIENGSVYNYDASAPIEVSYKKPFKGEPLGRTNPELLTKLHPSHGHDQAIVNGVSRIGYMKGGGKALWKDEDIADMITDKALEFIDNNQDNPFFLYFGTNDVHVPRVPNEKFAGKSGLGARGDALLSFDYCVGRVLDKLEELGLTENTIVILSSDNGPVLDDGYKDRAVELNGDHRPWGDYRGGKYSSFEAGTRVPFIVKWPSHTTAGTVSDVDFSQIDLLASIADAIGATIDTTAAPKLDSRSALNTMLGKKIAEREYIIEHNSNNNVSILKDGWKFIPAFKGLAINKLTGIELGNNPEDQLYNINEDINEQKNLAKQYPEKVAELRTLLNAEKAKGMQAIPVKGSVSDGAKKTK